jgi:hypothetical protein
VFFALNGIEAEGLDDKNRERSYRSKIETVEEPMTVTIWKYEQFSKGGTFCPGRGFSRANSMKPQCPADISTFLGRCSDSRA